MDLWVVEEGDGGWLSGRGGVEMRWLHAIYLGLSNQRSRNEASQLSEQRGFVKMVPEGLGQGVRFLCIGGEA